MRASTLIVLLLTATATAAAAQTMSVDPADPIVIEVPLNADPPITFIVNVTADRTTNWIVTGLPKWLKASTTFGRTPAAVTFTVTPPVNTIGASFGTTLFFTNLRTRLGDTARAVAVEVVAEEPKPSPNATWRLDGIVTPVSFTNIGTVLHFAYVATNTGNAPIAGVALLPTLDADCPAGDIKPGERLSCAFDYTVTQTDLAAGRVLDTTALVSVDGLPLALAMPLTSVYVPPLSAANASWQVENVTPTPTFYAGPNEQIDFSFKLTNLTQQPITNYGMVANEFGWLCQGAVLESGASALCSGSHVTDQSDVDAGVFRFGLYIPADSIEVLRLNASAAYTPPYRLLCGDGPCLDDKGGRLVAP